MVARSSMCRGARSRVRLAGNDAAIDYASFSRSVNIEVMHACSLWARREPKVSASDPPFNSELLLLASRHLGYKDSADLWRLSPQMKPGRIMNAANNTRIVYQDGISDGMDGQQSDIWLGFSRLRSYLVLNLENTGGRKTIRWLDGLSDHATDDRAAQEVDADYRRAFDSEVEPGDAVSAPETTLFVYPYTRSTSKVLVDALNRHRLGLGELDIQSLVYMCGSTGSSRSVRLLGQLLRENCQGHETTSAIHRVEEHAWPWMNDGKTKSIGRIGVPLVLDALGSAAIIRYTFEKESSIFDYVESVLQKVDAKVKEGDCAVDDEIKALDEAILSRIVQLLILKRNFSSFNSGHIRVFSDFICDRLHRIDSRSIANIAFSLGHSKHLDEFWMFMMAKRIQDHPSDFGPDEIAAIMDAYSNACLEDYDFYAILCQEVARNFDQYSIHHLTVILRSLAHVRVRDEWLLGRTLERLENHLTGLEKTGSPHMVDRELAYAAANCVVAAGDLDYLGDCSFDSTWRLLTSCIRESSFDICAINWLPLAAMTFANRTTLQTFMPVWLRHVAHTIQKLRSKTFVHTIQRRHHFVRHVFRLGILPSSLLPKRAQKLLDDICDTTYVGGAYDAYVTVELSRLHDLFASFLPCTKLSARMKRQAGVSLYEDIYR